MPNIGLALQLAIYHQLQRKIVSARKWARWCPLKLFKRKLAKAEREATEYATSLMEQVPSSHDEAVHALTDPHSSSSLLS
ncbi:hypothetical protein [Hymenobacter sp. YC55]|uniref:hypothetical protein n=1 Tax=Hymenobacter sp. YC55 TaxID=3034019 RepID=UPI0023F6539C|nr:hypothetical protein [Hymenobacter sp. YC55]MDF7810733.1 hypothetical protein [Hymenobacter sp. YC55]